jgi:hypothetical protein
MKACSLGVGALLRKPSGYIPLVMSATALALLLGFLAVSYAMGHPAEPTEDEAVGAHLYQLLIGLQVFPIGWFVLRWGLAAPLAASGVLALQVLAVCVTFVPRWYFGL